MPKAIACRLIGDRFHQLFSATSDIDLSKYIVFPDALIEPLMRPLFKRVTLHKAPNLSHTGTEFEAEETRNFKFYMEE